MRASGRFRVELCPSFFMSNVQMFAIHIGRSLIKGVTQYDAKGISVFYHTLATLTSSI